VYRTSTSLIGTELPGTVSLTVIELSDVPTTSGGAHFFGAPELGASAIGEWNEWPVETTEPPKTKKTSLYVRLPIALQVLQVLLD